MLTYEYICRACSKQFEIQQSIKDDPITKCPTCGRNLLKRLIASAGQFYLKGDGWYRDGYSSSKSK